MYKRLFCITLFAVAPLADACKPTLDYRREPAHAAYDAAYTQWARDTADVLVKDADPNIAWASLVLLMRTREEAYAKQLDLPPEPTSGAGRLMRYAYCGESERCPPAITQWVDIEPDNLFVLAVALHENERYASKARRKLDGVTRYDDYFGAARVLEETLLARVPAPPVAPAGYVLPPCSELAFDAVAPRPNLGNQPVVLGAPSVFLNDGKLATPLRLKIAELLVASKGSPLTTVAGARLGSWAAVDNGDLEHYCTLYSRARSFDSEVYEWILHGGHGVDPGVRNDYFAALATRNGVDALVEIAARLPEKLAPKAIDEAELTQCKAKLTGKTDEQTP
jgi:hypothetical protein